MEYGLIGVKDFIRFSHYLTGFSSIFYFLFLYMGAYFSIRSSWYGGLYHLSTAQITAVGCHLFGIRELGIDLVSDAILSGVAVVLFEYLFVDLKTANVPVYLGYSRKSQICQNKFIGIFPGTKHWSVIIPENDEFKAFWVYHAKGDIFLGLEGKKSRYSLSLVWKKYYGFCRLGVTTRERIDKFVPNEVSGFYTCQQYSRFVSNKLVWPYSSVDCIYGRISYYLVAVLGVALVFLVNLVFRLNIDLNVSFTLFYLFDFLSEYGYGDGKTRREFTGTITGVFLGSIFFMILTLLQPYKFNGIFPLVVVSADLLIIYLILPSFSREFPQLNFEDQLILKKFLEKKKVETKKKIKGKKVTKKRKKKVSRK